jgi:hypothetical protein
MENVAVQKARDVDGPAREWLQRIFGRSLAEDDEVTVLVSAPHPASSGAGRRAASERIEEVLDRAAQNMRNVSAAEFDTALDEALSSVRPRKS